MSFVLLSIAGGDRAAHTAFCHAPLPPRAASASARRPRRRCPAKRRAPATQATTTAVTPSIEAGTASCSSQAASRKPKKGCSSCNWPTPAMPPSASPRYQNTKPISMLNRDT